MTVTQGQDGGVFFDPIPGDMLRTMHTEPQVGWIHENTASKKFVFCILLIIVYL